MAEPAPVYKLRSMLQGHSMGVKHVSVVQEPSGALLTASRDETARMWYQREDNSHSVRKIYKGHTKYVYQEPSEEFPSGLIFTADVRTGRSELSSQILRILCSSWMAMQRM